MVLAVSQTVIVPHADTIAAMSGNISRKKAVVMRLKKEEENHIMYFYQNFFYYSNYLNFFGVNLLPGEFFRIKNAESLSKKNGKHFCKRSPYVVSVRYGSSGHF